MINDFAPWRLRARTRALDAADEPFTVAKGGIGGLESVIKSDADLAWAMTYLRIAYETA